MKLNIVTIVLSVLLVETQCGVIDNIFGKVKNITVGLKQDVSNVVSYGKELVGLESEESVHKERQRGFIGGILHTTKEKLHSVRNYFWNSDELSEDRGIFGNLFNRIKNKIMKIKGNATDEKVTYNETEQVKHVRESLNKLFFNNGTRQINGKAFQDAIKKLREEIHNRTFSKTTTKRPVYYGEGALDVRAIPNVNPEIINNNINSINNDVYDKVDDTLNQVNHNIDKSYKIAKDRANSGINGAKERVNNALSNIDAKLTDTAAKENDLLNVGYNKFNKNVANLADDVKRSIEDLQAY